MIEKFSELSTYAIEIIDCANGSLSKIAPKVLKELQLILENMLLNLMVKILIKTAVQPDPTRLIF